MKSQNFRSFQRLPAPCPLTSTHFVPLWGSLKGLLSYALYTNVNVLVVPLILWQIFYRKYYICVTLILWIQKMKKLKSLNYSSFKILQMTNPKPRINLDEPRYDQSTFSGRAKHFFITTNPLNLLATGRKLDHAKSIVERYR